MAEEKEEDITAEEEEEKEDEEIEDEAERRARAAKEEARRLYMEKRFVPPPYPQLSEIVQDKLGGYEFFHKVLKSPKYVTAPMVDQSFLPFRMFTRKYGAELCYTPMLHSKTFSHDPTYRKKYFSTVPEDRPLVVQFCANEPLFLLKAARMVEDKCDAVDINLGCPQNIARKGNYGAFLMDSPEVVYELVNILHKFLKIPVYCKMRVFPSEEQTIKFAKMLESAGCQLLTVHGRTKEQKGHQQGLANFDIIRKIKEELSIPVIANGNIREFEDIQTSLAATKADGVMSAETILCNPALFSGKTIHPCDLAHEFMDLCENQYPMPFKYTRTHLLQILRERLDYNADLRIAMMRTRNIAMTRKVVEDIRARESGGATVLRDLHLREKRATIKAAKEEDEKFKPGGEKDFIESHVLFKEDEFT
eukprot:Phypoly_transcript_02554.p1 GENE.Phypoly_transcript_02554~~Phypoly_transcript_02554.p1  ORF type:complete len:420 (+),score=86.72 Phypoly_transcript_02554:1501-2760(+)